MTTTTTPDTSTSVAAARLAELHDIASSYLTCEFATVNRAGLPFAWPAVCEIAPDGSDIVLTTCIGFPRKAFNVRRDPRVALLFSDPTGTGRTDLPQVLVQGLAVCPDEIRTSPAGLESYWRQLWRRQPSSLGYARNWLGRRLFAFYYYRLVITVTPDAVTVGAPLPMRRPQHADRVARRTATPFAAVARRLPGFGDAVLAFVAGDESDRPELRRVRAAADAGTGRLILDSADGGTLCVPSGNATLLLHSHDDELTDQRLLNVVGVLEWDGDSVTLRPDRVVDAAEAVGPLATLRVLRRLHRSTDAYLQRRGLTRPAVPWQEYVQLQAEL
jgi:hypothetical protein